MFTVRKTDDGITLGFNARRSDEIVDLGDCSILHPDLLDSLPALRRVGEAAPWPRFDLAVTLCENGVDLDMRPHAPGARARRQADPVAMSAVAALVAERPAEGPRLLRASVDGDPLLTLAPPIVSFDGVMVAPPPGAFLQASVEGESALRAAVAASAAGARKIADLFCGAGTFALPLARDATVAAFDSDEPAIVALEKASRDAQRMGLKMNPVDAVARNLFERPLTPDELSRFDAVVIDPPRAGAKAQAEQLALAARKKGPLRIISVSCNPATFARDAALLEEGGYALSRATIVDQFVYSPHIELVGVFERL